MWSWLMYLLVTFTLGFTDPVSVVPGLDAVPDGVPDPTVQVVPAAVPSDVPS